MKYIKDVISIHKTEEFDTRRLVDKLITRLSCGEKTLNGEDICYILMGIQLNDIRF